MYVYTYVHTCIEYARHGAYLVQWPNCFQAMSLAYECCIGATPPPPFLCYGNGGPDFHKRTKNIIHLLNKIYISTRPSKTTTIKGQRKIYQNFKKRIVRRDDSCGKLADD